MSSTDHAFTRTHTVDWQDPAEVRRHASGWTGLRIMQAIRDGSLPPPPIGKLIGFCCTLAEPGCITMEVDAAERLENPAGLIHGGVAATLLDTVLAAAVHTRLPAESFPVTINLNITFLRRLTADSGRLRACGRVVNLGRTVACAEGDFLDGADRLAARAVANFSILASPSC